VRHEGIDVEIKLQYFTGPPYEVTEIGRQVKGRPRNRDLQLAALKMTDQYREA